MNDTRQLDRSDRIGMYLSTAMLVLVGATFIWLAIQRVVEVARGGGIPVDVPLDSEPVTVPLGPGGAAVDAVATTATVEVTDPAAATLFALYAQPIWMALTVCAGLAVTAAFFLRLARGRAYETGTAGLAYAGASILLAGWLGGSILTNMTTNGALSAI
ncbi:MAG: hypothetical protein ACK5IM_05770, partial [Demequina sp.]|uniref:hypothetical protein n=1 Tax=Demequina sp. TaxID=2050685 RepID=UPI003A86D0A0